MIVWTGWGIITALIGIAGMVFTYMVPNHFTGSDDYLKSHTWIWLVGMAVTALVNHGFYKLLCLQKPRVIVDPSSGREVYIRKSHTLFYIPIQYWSFVFLALGVLWIFVGDK